MNITSKVTYKIIRDVLLSKEFTQIGIKNRTGYSKGQISKVVNWLITRKFVEKRDRNYYLIDPPALVSVFPLFRNMNELLGSRIPLRGEKEKILENALEISGGNKTAAARHLSISRYKFIRERKKIDKHIN